MLPMPSAGPVRSLIRVMRPLEQGRWAKAMEVMAMERAFGLACLGSPNRRLGSPRTLTALKIAADVSASGYSAPDLQIGAP